MISIKCHIFVLAMYRQLPNAADKHSAYSKVNVPKKKQRTSTLLQELSCTSSHNQSHPSAKALKPPLKPTKPPPQQSQHVPSTFLPASKHGPRRFSGKHSAAVSSVGATSQLGPIGNRPPRLYIYGLCARARGHAINSGRVGESARRRI